MEILCLDLEGVLIPEIWQAVAERTGVAELGKTTRDIPVYDCLLYTSPSPRDATLSRMPSSA